MIVTEDRAHIHRAFATIDPARLDAADDTFLDALAFGVVGMSPAGNAEVYNAALVRLAGMKRESVLGQPFFLMAGVCMNNFMVAQRYEDEAELDTVIDYVLTFRMRPTPVKLRLVRRRTIPRRYLLIRV